MQVHEQTDVSAPTSPFAGNDLVSAFDAQACHSPAQVAVEEVGEGEQWTYDRLAQVSRSVAAALEASMVLESSRESPVVFVTPSTAGLHIACILGALRSGCAYCSLDMLDSPERNASVVRAIGARGYVVLVDSSSRELVERLERSGCTWLHLVQVDEYRASTAAVAAATAHDTRSMCGPESMAYVYFTSGSTGEPKGVLDNHRNVLDNVRRYHEFCGFERRDRCSLVQSFAFSAVVGTMFAALSLGCTLCRYDLRRCGVTGFAQWLADARVTVLHCVPTIFRSGLCSGPRALTLRCMRLIRLEGDSALPKDLQLFQRGVRKGTLSRRARLCCGLGSTETGIVCVLQCDADTEVHPSWHTLPVGRPCDGVALALVRDDGRAAGEGKTGELVVSSPHLALGYWENAELTARRFRPVPATAAAGLRSFWTGDVGLFTDSGLELRGRLQGTLKVGGVVVQACRMACLFEQLASVRSALVHTVASQPPASAHVVALIVSPHVRPARSELHAQLSHHQVPLGHWPRKFLFVDGVPLTRSGKVDWREVERMCTADAASPSAGSGSVAPASTSSSLPGTATDAVYAKASRLLLCEEAVLRGGADLFSVGLGSLSAQSLVALIHDELGELLSFSHFIGDTATLPRLIRAAQMAQHEDGASERAQRSRATANNSEIPYHTSQQQPHSTSGGGDSSSANDDDGFVVLTSGVARDIFLASRRLPSAYLMSRMLRLPATSTCASLRTALVQLLRETPALRATLALAPCELMRIGKLRIEVASPAQASSIVDREWRTHSGAQPPLVEHAHEWAREVTTGWAQQESAPHEEKGQRVMRACVGRERSTDRLLVVLGVHHAVCDATGAALIMGRLQRLLREAGEAEPQREAAERDRAFEGCISWLNAPPRPSPDSLRFWEEAVASMPPSSLLNGGGEQPRALHEEALLPAALVKALQSSMRPYRLTLAATLFAVFAVLLRRCTPGALLGEDLVICVPMSLRQRCAARLRDVVACCLSVVPMRVPPRGRDVHLTRWMSALAKQWSRGMDVAPHRAFVSGVVPTSPYTFVVHPADAHQARQVHRPLPEHTHDEVSLCCAQLADGSVRLQLECAASVYTAGEVRCLLQQYLAAVASAAACSSLEPEKRDAELFFWRTPPPPPTHPVQCEREREVAESGAGAARHSSLPAQVWAPHGVYSSVLGIAEERPHRVALRTTDGGVQLTYGALCERARQLAAALARIEPGKRLAGPIALFGERTLEVYVGVLAAWHLGLAYVPLRGELQPAEQLHILRSTGARALLYTGELTASVRAWLERERIPCIEFGEACRAAADGVLADAAPQPVELRPTDAAYVLFTSGSSGQSKGVVVEHRNLCWLATAQRAVYKPLASDVVLNFFSFGFDAFVEELLLALSNGGSIVVPRRTADLYDPAALRRILSECAVTVLTSVPRVLCTLRSPPDSLRLVISGGDTLSQSTVDTILQPYGARTSPLRLLNTYGPTETTVVSTWHRCRAGDPRAPPIGREFPGVSLLLADAEGCLRSASPSSLSVGELCVAGCGVARGYLRGVQSQRYVSVPAHLRGDGCICGLADCGERAYMTGDIVRVGGEGALHFVGRRDGGFVKVRGVRVDPTQVEHAMYEHSLVAEVVVLSVAVRGGDGLAQQLVANVVWVERPHSSRLEAEWMDALRRHLAARLPHWLLPSQTLSWSHFPTLAGGAKVDRRGLTLIAGERLAASPESPPIPAGSEGAGEDTHHALPPPQRRVLGHLLEALRYVRPAVQLRRCHSLLTLGLDSVQLIVLHSRLEDALRRRISMKLLYTAASVHELVRLLASPTSAGVADPARSNPSTKSGTTATSNVASASLFSAVHASIACPAAAVDQPSRARTAEACEVGPASSAQERVWLEEMRLDSSDSSTAYQSVLHLFSLPEHGHTMATVDRCVLRVCARHPALRTTFCVRDGRLQQSVRAAVAPCVLLSRHNAVPSHLLRAASHYKPLLTLAHQLDLLQSFHLEHGPLIRVALLNANEEPTCSHVCVVAHHIVCDDWSMRIFEQELLAAVGGQPLASVPPYCAPRQGAPSSTAVAYWQRQMRGAPPLGTVLPCGRSRTVPQRFAGRVLTQPLCAGTLRALADFAMVAGCTLHVALQAAFFCLLRRYTGETDLIVGTAVTTRGTAQLEAIDCFVGSVPLRVQISGDESFEEVTRVVHTALLDAMEHCELPLQEIVRVVGAPHDPSAAPLFQIMFVSELQAGSHAPSATTASHSRSDLFGVVPNHNFARADMLLTVRHLKGVSELIVEHSEMVPDSLVECLASLYETLLRGAVDCPDVACDTIPLVAAGSASLEISSTQEPSLTTIATATPCEDSDLLSLVERPPTSHTAVVTSDGVEISYGQLRATTADLVVLIAPSLAAEASPIAIVLEKGWQQAVAVLAVLGCGQAFTVISPDAPQLRREQVLKQSRCSTVVTSRALEGTLRWPASVRTVVVPALRESDGDACHPPLRLVQARPSSLAYVLFTSGSTGAPKGCMLSHESVLNTVLDFNQRFAVSATDRTFALSSLSFDLSIYDLFGAWAAGGAVVYPHVCHRLSPEHWMLSMRRHRVTVWNTVPSLASLLVDYCEGTAAVAPLRVCILSGDWIPQQLPGRFCTQFPALQFMSSGGGATECAIWSILHPLLPPTPCEWTKSVPYGRAMSNQQVMVLDHLRQECPAWVVGELYISGRGVAMGYLGDRRRTDDSFVRLETCGGTRAYRTGDLGIRLPSGVVVFRGRVDFQVKLRGFRIELGEVEAQLCKHPAVDRSCCTIRGESEATQQLVAFVSPKSSHTEAMHTCAIRSWVAARLPKHMVPQRVVLLSSLPLTPNGKVSRKLLANVDISTAPAGISAEAGGVVDALPPTPRLRALERHLLEAWRAELPQAASASANLFELGATSIMVARVSWRLSRRLGKPVTPRLLFEHTTVRSLASALAGSHSLSEPEVTAPSAASGEAGSRVGALPSAAQPVVLAPGLAPASAAQARMWAASAVHPGAYTVTTVTLLSPAPAVAALRHATAVLLSRYHALRTTLCQQDDAQLMQLVSEVDERLVSSVFVAVHVSEVAQLCDADLQALVVRHTGRTFRVDSDKPLLRVVVLHDEDAPADACLLVLHAHHIIVDQHSLQKVRAQLLDLVDGGRSGEGAVTSAEPPPPQYIHFTLWQQRRLRGSVLDAHVRHWSDRVAALVRSQNIGMCFFGKEAVDVRPGSPHRAGLARVEAPAGLRESVLGVAQTHRCSPFHVVAAALMAVLHRHTACEDVLVGVPVSDRHNPAYADTVGCMLNTVLLHSRVEGRPSARSYLRAVNGAVLTDLEHSELPFESVTQMARAAGWPDSKPLFHVMLVYEDAAFPHPGWSFEARLLEVEALSPKVPATLFVRHCGAAAAKHGNERWEMRMEYDESILSSWEAERSLHHFVRMLHVLATQPTTSLLHAPLMDPAERAELLSLGHWTPRLLEPLSDSVPTRIRRHVERCPHAVALHSGAGDAVSYGELWERAKSVASALHGRSALVGVCMEPSVHLVVALVGVWLSGRAYVPLDPAQPLRVLRDVVEAADLAVCLTTHRHTQGRLWELLNVCPALQPVFMEESAATPSAPASSSTSSAIAPTTAWRSDPDAMAYVLFTSGTTGQPKGVRVAHGSLGEYVAHCAGHYLPARGCEAWTGGEVPFHSPLTFDATVTSLWLPLCVGAVVRVVTADAVTQDWFWRRLGALEFPWLFVKLTPGQLNVLRSARARRSAAGHVAELRVPLIVAGGAQLMREHLTWMREMRGAAETTVVNEYGPTEATVGTVFARMDLSQLPEAEASPLPIGRPVASACAAVVGEEGELAAWGVPGELYLSGRCLALGYQRGAGEGAFQRALDRRCYATGDLCRWNERGELEFIRRIGSSNKFRGYRVDLEQLRRAAKEATESVVDAVAAVLRCGVTPSGVEELVLFAQPLASLSEVKLEECSAAIVWHCATALPRYATPTAVRLVPHIPMTSHGKVDYVRLRQLFTKGAEPRAASVPSPDARKRVANLWQEFLGTAIRWDEDAGWYQYGGDSMLWVMMLHRLQSWRHAPVLPELISKMHRCRTVDDLARLLDLFSKEGTAAVPSAFTGASGDVALMVAQQPSSPVAAARLARNTTLTPAQHWFFHQTWADPNQYFQDRVLRCSSNRAPTVCALRAALLQMVERHEALRTAFVRDSSRCVRRRVVPFDDAALASSLLSVQQLSSTGALHVTEPPPLSVQHGRLFHVVYFRAADGGGVLLLIVHHLAVDWASWSVLVSDLCAELDSASSAGGDGDDERIAGQGTTPLNDWLCALEDYTESREFEARMLSSRVHYQSLAEKARQSPWMLPGKGKLASVPSVGSLVVTTSFEVAPVARALGVHSVDVFLAVLLRCWRGYANTDALYLLMETHGRNALHGRSGAAVVGWLTCFQPILLCGGRLGGMHRMVRMVQQNRRGADAQLFSALQYLSDSALPTEDLPVVSFNYLAGGTASAATVLTEADVACPFISAQPYRVNFLDLVLWVSAEDTVEVHCHYDSSAYTERDIQGLLDRYLEQLQVVRTQVVGSASPEPALRACRLAGLDTSSLQYAVALSPTQRRFLAESMADESHSRVHLLQHVFALSESAKRLRRALDSVAAAYPILRCGLLPDQRRGDQPPAPHFVVLRADGDPRVRWREWTGALHTFLEQDRAAGFRLAADSPLWRFAVVHDPQKSRARLVVTMHHAAVDAVTMRLVLEAVQQQLRASTTVVRVAPRSPGARANLADAEWRTESHRFWIAWSKPYLPLLRLSGAVAGEVGGAFVTDGSVPIPLSASHVDDLQRVARGLQVSMSALLHAAFAVALACHCTPQRGVIQLATYHHGRMQPHAQRDPWPHLVVMPTYADVYEGCPLLGVIRSVWQQHRDVSARFDEFTADVDLHWRSSTTEAALVYQTSVTANVTQPALVLRRSIEPLPYAMCLVATASDALQSELPDSHIDMLLQFQPCCATIAAPLAKETLKVLQEVAAISPP
jgi:amino acid adenylation domain-containing protein